MLNCRCNIYVLGNILKRDELYTLDFAHDVELCLLDCLLHACYSHSVWLLRDLHQFWIHSSEMWDLIRFRVMKPTLPHAQNSIRWNYQADKHTHIIALEAVSSFLVDIAQIANWSARIFVRIRTHNFCTMCAHKKQHHTVSCMRLTPVSPAMIVKM